jgi:hypothetical protein
MRTFLRPLALAVATMAIVAGCSSGSTKAATSSAGTSGSPSSRSASSTASSSSAASTEATEKVTVDANTASEAEIAAALTANGVSNGSRWAKEVAEYRPYPTDDPTFAKLKANLAKYKPGQTVLDGIIASLTL